MTDRFDSLQQKTENWRGRFFKPILPYLTLHPNSITTFRLLLALSFPFLIISRPTIAWVLISLSIVLDSFDGVVARFQHTANDRGKFIDVLADQMTFVVLCLGLIRLLPDMGLILASLGFAIPLTYLIVMIHRNEKEPSDWIIKPQARLVGYKVIFLILIISYLSKWLSTEVIIVLLWLEVITSSLHFSIYYYKFINRSKI